MDSLIFAVEALPTAIAELPDAVLLEPIAMELLFQLPGFNVALSGSFS